MMLTTSTMLMVPICSYRYDLFIAFYSHPPRKKLYYTHEVDIHHFVGAINNTQSKDRIMHNVSKHMDPLIMVIRCMKSIHLYVSISVSVHMDGNDHSTITPSL